jgi:ribosome-associated translation inhibitor RaiA
MRLEIRRRGLKVSEELRSHIEERLRLALARFARYVSEVWVYLRAVNGPRGVARKCRVVVRLPPAGRVVVVGSEADGLAAVKSSADRAKFAVRRHLKRRLARRRCLQRPARRMAESGKQA